MHVHLLFDLLAYSTAILSSLTLFKSPKKIYPQNLSSTYYTTLISGFIIGAISIGSLNSYYSLGEFVLSKSIMGALFGGLVAVELFKHYYKLQGSTGAYFVPSLTLGIVIGRIGCFMGGLEDFTYGIETNFFLGYDFGDGIKRHPVQLYESFLMFLFFIYALKTYYFNHAFFEKNIFYIFIIYYALQRFMLEYLKPYKDFLLGLNIFHFLSIMMILYGVYFLRKKI